MDTDTNRNRFHPALLAAMRLAVAAVWLYEGLWLKVLRPAPHEMAVVQTVTIDPFSPRQMLAAIGWGETLLGVAVLSGAYTRLLAVFQAVILVSMNAIGIAYGGTAIADPVGLVIHNLPLLLCILALAVHGPGAGAISPPGKRP